MEMEIYIKITLGRGGGNIHLGWNRPLDLDHQIKISTTGVQRGDQPLTDQVLPIAPTQRAPQGDPPMGVFPNKDTTKENRKIKERDQRGEKITSEKGKEYKGKFFMSVPNP